MPKLPKDHSEWVSVHLGGQLLRHFFNLAQDFRWRPNCGNPVIWEYIAVFHKVKILKIWNSNFDQEGAILYLLEVDKNVVRRKMPVSFDFLTRMESIYDFWNLKGYLVLNQHFFLGQFLTHYAIERVLIFGMQKVVEWNWFVVK